MNREYILIIGLIIVFAIILIVFKSLKPKKVILSQSTGSEIVNSLGGSDNIVKYEAKVSRLNVYVKDASLVDVDLIKEITSCGVMFVNDKVQIILKDNVEAMNNILNDLKMRD